MGCCNCFNEADENEEVKSFLLYPKMGYKDGNGNFTEEKKKREREY